MEVLDILRRLWCRSYPHSAIRQYLSIEFYVMSCCHNPLVINHNAPSSFSI